MNDGPLERNRELDEGPLEPWEWPRCPECGQPRQTRCPGCSIPGSHFLLADYAPPVAEVRRTRRSTAIERAGEGGAGGAPAREAQVTSELRLSARDEELDGLDQAELLPEPVPVHESVWLLCSLCEEAFQPRFYRYCEKCGHDYGSGIEVDDLSMEWPERVVIVAIVLISVTTGLIGYFWMLLR